MQPAVRIGRFQWTVLRRNYAVLGSHAAALLSLLLLALLRARQDRAQAPTLIAVLLLGAASGAPLSLGVHALVGERFRGTLEALLVLPIHRASLLAGKVAAVVLVSVVEMLAVVAGVAVLAVVTSDFALLSAVVSTPVLLILAVGAPQLSLLLTLVVVVISGRARDAQTASTLSMLACAPVAALTLALWFGALALGPRLVFVAIAVLTVLIAVGMRLATAWLTDDRLVSRRG